MNEALRRAIKKYQQSQKGKIAVRNAVKKYFGTDDGRKARVKFVQTYMSRKKGLLASLTVLEWEQVIIDFDGSCAYCGAKVKLLQEHFIPVSRGGTYTRDNIVPACKPCNNRKKDKDPREWLPREDYERIANYLRSR